MCLRPLWSKALRVWYIAPMGQYELSHLFLILCRSKALRRTGGDHSNVFKTIVKQGIEGSLGYCTNGPITIGKSDFKGGMTTYAQKWKTDEICRRKSPGGLHVEKNHQDCGAPPPQGECWSGLNPPILSTDNKVTGATTNMLRKKIEKNATTLRRSRDHKHIGLIMKENLGCQMSYHHLASIEITCACRVWHFITQPMKHYKIMQREGALSILVEIGPRKKSRRQWLGVPTSQILQRNKLLILLLKQKKKWHRTRHIWYAMKNLKVISQQQWRFHQLRQSLTSKNNSDQYWTCRFH